MLSPILLFASVAFALPACEIAKESIVSRSSLGLAQVSNLGGIRITCRVPARPFPTTPGEHRYGLKIATTAYEISADGRKKLVPSKVQIVVSRKSELMIWRYNAVRFEVHEKFPDIAMSVAEV
jgi:hypothetical protein